MSDMSIASSLCAALSLDPKISLLIVLAAFTLPFVIGTLIASSLRMPDYGWKIGLILCTTLVSLLAIGKTYNPDTGKFDLPRGVDLKGGVILVYEVDESATRSSDTAKPEDKKGPAGGASFDMSALIEALKRRINPSGTKEIVIRPFGEKQVEIVIPDIGEVEVERIKRQLSTAGVLQFRIVANGRDHKDVIDLAEEVSRDPLLKRGRIIYDDERTPIGLWARVARDTNEVRGVRPFKTPVLGDVIRDASTGEILQIPADRQFSEDYRLEDYLKEQGIKEIDVLVWTHDGYDVNGSHLGAVSSSFDEQLVPCVNFNMRGAGAALFGGLTSSNVPEGEFYRRLAILLDNEIISAPRLLSAISDRGRITGNFSQEEVDFLVNILRAGSLPVVLNKTPISENQISALLGEDTIRKGTTATWVSLLAVVVFMLIYYRMSGLIACLALLLNLVLVVATMVLINAPFTLPGLAGLVLTVGMSVDANVLIYERMREEMAKGSALRMTIRNGFSRAMSTIIDANLTTVLTAVILYVIGTDQLRGFAVTLILGLLISMFTAIFVARVCFDITERRRWLTEIRMMHLVGETHFDFIAYSKYFIAVSIIIIALGTVATAWLGANILDTDMAGGTTVHMILKKPIATEEVRQKLETKFESINKKGQFTVTGINAGTTGVTDIFKIDSSLEEVKALQELISDAFHDESGQLMLRTYGLEFTPPQEQAVTVEPKAGSQPETTPTTEVPPSEKPSNEKAESTPTKEEKTDAPALEKASPAGDKKDSDPPAETPKSEPAPATESKPANEVKAPDSPADPKTEGQEKAPPTNPPAAEGEKGAEEKTSNQGARLDLPPDTELALLDDPATPATSEPPADKKADDEKPAEEKSAEEKPAEAKATDSSVPPPAATGEPTVEAQPAPETQPATAEKPADAPPADSKPASVEPAASAEPARIQTTTDLTFTNKIDAATLREQIQQIASDLKISLDNPELYNPDWDGQSSVPYSKWTLRTPLTAEQTRQIVESLQAKVASTPVWEASSKIGGQVAGDTKERAVVAMVLSCIGIVIYVWFRFQHLVYGVAAVVALVHDVLVTVAFIAMSHWLAAYFHFLLVDEFKISLSVIAALLTIIGYSINDTIVIFDRIREVKGKSPVLTGEMVNLSVNQTLGRTILTAVTVFIVVLILYAMGGEGIHAFAYSLLVGVIAGSYSTVFIASPLVLWITGTPVTKNQRSADKKAAV